MHCAIPIVLFHPKEPILISSELNFSIEFNNRPVQQDFHTTMYGVSGIDLYPWPSLKLSQCHGYSCPKNNLIIFLSTIEFYVNNTPPSGYTCSSNIIPDETPHECSFFSSYLNSLTINYGNTYASSSQAVCPYIFKNAQLDNIYLMYQVDSFLFGIKRLLCIFNRYNVENLSLTTI
jgi:hypothetical protein